MTKARRSFGNSFVRAILVVVSLLWGFVEFVAHGDRVRRVSANMDESRRRGLFRRTLVVTDSLAPSPSGPIRIEEAWREAERRTRLGILPFDTGRERLVLRVNTESSDVYFHVQGLDWPRDTIVVHQQFHGGPRVRFASREYRLPDTVRFLEPPTPPDR